MEKFRKVIYCEVNVLQRQLGRVLPVENTIVARVSCVAEWEDMTETDV